MTWSVTFNGDATAIRQQFKEAFERSKSNKMDDRELSDIANTADYVAEQANRHGVLKGTAHGGWVSLVETEGQPPTLKFDTINVSVSRSLSR